MTDFPDWQTAAATQSANAFSSFTQTLTPGSHAGSVTPVYSWQSIALTVKPSAGACKVTASHYADSAGSHLVSADTWDVNSTVTLTARVPLRGPYVQLTIDVTSAGDLTAETWAVYQTYPADRVSFPVSGQYVFEPDNTLAAGATKTYDLPAIVAGHANWSFVPFDNAGQLNPYVQAVDELGTVLARVSDRGNPTAIDNALLAVPDRILQVVVVNGDSGNTHEYGFSFIVPPQ